MTPTAALSYAFMLYIGATLPSLIQIVQIWGCKMFREIFSHCVYQVPIPKSTG